ncbi:MAG TPA: phosphatase PAP2 family protein [Candidatus Thiothrix moscowensis]|uniref:phosphatase PAP2 family protein n=1 Tax=unclassified Thiothrix TaxID=2636184 RepID=UPI0025D91CF6|nr:MULTISPECIES: phosphatase PAP2 family protein [unclassified Thiothrix]HRJ51295.1 phosphatase PAP2 family protein [Candidatus Thiothrix moscowensis]HRJ91650.1 phosphatase PAP2 family protein [Candidatus Thiothrix moscowensis]
MMQWWKMFWKQHPQAWLWLNLVAASTVVFWFSGWDLTVAAGFYEPQAGWLLDDFPLWKAVFYDGVPYVAGVVLIASLLLILASTLLRRWYRGRLYAAYVLFVFLLGPGLLVNALFKDHWGRARPVQVEQLGGTATYTPPLYYVANGEGRSFPSGHSSVGFAFIAFWFLLRRHKPGWAKLALTATLVFGCLIGLTRMAAGGHFLSDVMWSGWLALFAGWVLYYPLMRIAERERRWQR